MNSTAIRNRTFTQGHFILARKHRRIQKPCLRLVDRLLSLWFYTEKNIQVEQESFRIYSNKRSEIKYMYTKKVGLVSVYIKILIFLSFGLTFRFVCIMVKNKILVSLLGSSFDRCKTTNLNMFQKGRPLHLVWAHMPNNDLLTYQWSVIYSPNKIPSGLRQKIMLG